jgi:biopolymer transport protein ExbB
MGEMFGTLAKHYHEGGWMMHPILASLFVVVGLVIDRAFALYVAASVDKEAFLKGLKDHIYRGDLDRRRRRRSSR